ncbi:MAG: hypothetical protein WDO15_06890 [Bacteroidota bacterium]
MIEGSRITWYPLVGLYTCGVARGSSVEYLEKPTIDTRAVKMMLNFLLFVAIEG